MINCGKWISKSLGYEYTPSTRIVCVSLVIISIFYLFVIGSSLLLPVYIVDHRVTYNVNFDKHLVGDLPDHIGLVLSSAIWFGLSISGKLRIVTFCYLISLISCWVFSHNDIYLQFLAISSPLLIAFYCFYNTRKKIIVPIFSPRLYFNYLGIAMFVLAIIGLISIIPPLYQISYVSPIPNFTYHIFVLLSSASPLLVLILVFGLPLKILIYFLLGARLRRVEINLKTDGVVPYPRKAIYLSLCVFLAILVTLIPHLPAVNSGHQRVGVDTQYYVKWINVLANTSNPVEFFDQSVVKIHQGDRPLSLILIYAFTSAFNYELSDELEYLPIVLAPILVVVIYFLAREITSRDDVSLIASFLTGSSYSVLIGIYAGFYSNWVALIIGYVSIIFLLRYLKYSKKRNALFFGSLLVAVLFSHAATWTVLALLISMFLVLIMKFGNFNRKNVLILLTAVIVLVVFDLVKIYTIGSPGGIYEDFQVANVTNTGLGQFAVRWSNLVYTIQVYYASQFSNVILLGLSVWWLFTLQRFNASNLFLLFFLSLGILPLLFGDPAVQGRVLYDIPIQIIAALGLVSIRNRTNGLLAASILLCLLVISIRAVSNFFLPL